MPSSSGMCAVHIKEILIGLEKSRSPLVEWLRCLCVYRGFHGHANGLVRERTLPSRIHTHRRFSLYAALSDDGLSRCCPAQLVYEVSLLLLQYGFECVLNEFLWFVLEWSRCDRIALIGVIRSWLHTYAFLLPHLNGRARETATRQRIEIHMCALCVCVVM